MAGQFSRRGFLLGGASGTLVLASGCDLLELAQNPVFNFRLPPKKYTLRTDDPNWKAAPALFNQAISCTSKDTCCPTSVPECASVPAVCQSGVCGIEFPLEVFNTIDLAKEAPELAGMGSKVISEITLKSLEFTITNGVNIDFPAVQLFVAPASTMTASGAGVEAIGETPVAKRNEVTKDTRNTPAAAQKAFANYAKNFNVPFNIIARTTLAVLSGTAVGMGKVDIEVAGTISAKLAL